MIATTTLPASPRNKRLNGTTADDAKTPYRTLDKGVKICRHPGKHTWCRKAHLVRLPFSSRKPIYRTASIYIQAFAAHHSSPLSHEMTSSPPLAKERRLQVSPSASLPPGHVMHPDGQTDDVN